MDNKSIKARQHARKRLLQALYQWEMGGGSLLEIKTQLLTHASTTHFDTEFFSNALSVITAELSSIDKLYLPFVERSENELNTIEKHILRMGTYEFKYQLDVPYKVVINEYIRLTKTFGAENSHHFMNGVLDKLARKLRAVEMNIDSE